MAHSIVFFPGATNADVEAFYKAAESGEADFNNYLSAHPAAKRYADGPKSAGYAPLSGEEFHSINAFCLTNMDGKVTTGRYGVNNVSRLGSAREDDDLEKDFRYLLDNGDTIEYDLDLYVAGPSESTNDVTSLWSDVT